MMQKIIVFAVVTLAGAALFVPDVTLARGMAVRLLAKDYIGKFNFQDATGLGLNGDVSHNLAFTAGLRFDF